MEYQNSCGQTFPSEYLLNHHKKEVHSFSHVLVLVLVRHKMIHTGEKPYECIKYLGIFNFCNQINAVCPMPFFHYIILQQIMNPPFIVVVDTLEDLLKKDR